MFCLFFVSFCLLCLRLQQGVILRVFVHQRLVHTLYCAQLIGAKVIKNLDASTIFLKKYKYFEFFVLNPRLLQLWQCISQYCCKVKLVASLRVIALPCRFPVPFPPYCRTSPVCLINRNDDNGGVFFYVSMIADIK